MKKITNDNIDNSNVISKSIKIKWIFSLLITAVLCISISTFAAFQYKADEVLYTEDISVKDALDSLYSKYSSNSSSFELVWTNPTPTIMGSQDIFIEGIDNKIVLVKYGEADYIEGYAIGIPSKFQTFYLGLMAGGYSRARKVTYINGGLHFDIAYQANSSYNFILVPKEIYIYNGSISGL